MESAVPSLVALDSSMGGFARDLDILDNTNNRTVDTAHVFYVQAGQTAALDILSNVVRYFSLVLDCFKYLGSKIIESVYERCGIGSYCTNEVKCGVVKWVKRDTLIVWRERRVKSL